MAGIFGIGISALNAAQVGLATVEHNIANANTPGFNRQEVSLAARQAQYTGSGFCWTGSGCRRSQTCVQRVHRASGIAGTRTVSPAQHLLRANPAN